MENWLEVMAHMAVRLRTQSVHPDGETVLSLLSIIAQLGSTEVIALAELKIEMMIPADETTRNLLLGMSGQSH